MRRTIVYTNSAGDTHVSMTYTAREAIDYLEMLNRRYDKGSVTVNGRESSTHAFSTQDPDGFFTMSVTIIPWWDDDRKKR